MSDKTATELRNSRVVLPIFAGIIIITMLFLFSTIQSAEYPVQHHHHGSPIRLAHIILMLSIHLNSVELFMPERRYLQKNLASRLTGSDFLRPPP